MLNRKSFVISILLIVLLLGLIMCNGNNDAKNRGVKKSNSESYGETVPNSGKYYFEPSISIIEAIFRGHHTDVLIRIEKILD